MKTRSAHGVLGTLLGGLIGVGVGAVLLITDNSPMRIIGAFRVGSRKSLRAAAGESVLDVLLLISWLVAAVLVVRSVLHVVALLRTTGRRLRTMAAGHGIARWTSPFLMTIAALLSSPKNAGEPTTPEPSTTGAAEPDERLHSIGSRPRTGRDTSTLPALASSGLAVGLTTHVQRRRAEALASAPSNACLARLSAPSLATGIALFERAKSGELPTPTKTEFCQAEDPLPMLIPLGVDGDRLVTVALEAGDTLSIDAEEEEALRVLRHLLNTVVLAPWLGHPTVVLLGFPVDQLIVNESVRIARDEEDVVEYVVASRSARPADRVIVITRSYVTSLERLTELGVLVISSRAETSRPVTRVVRELGGWRISPGGETFRPYGVSMSEVGNLRSAVQEMVTIETRDPEKPSALRAWQALVRVLGPVEVVRPDDSEVVFRKSKSVELLCWLAFHRDRPTVSGARTALWDVDVRDATFHNVLSELRRGLAAVGLSGSAGRSGKHLLFLDEGLVTDGDLLRVALDASERMPAEEACRNLCEVLRLVRGLPFSSANFTWADAEGITSTLYWLVTRSVERVAALCEWDRTGQVLAVATTAGLRMAPGDEWFMELQQRIRVSS